MEQPTIAYESSIVKIDSFIAERGECMPHRMDDDFLLRFLRARNFNVNRAHRLVSELANSPCY